MTRKPLGRGLDALLEATGPESASNETGGFMMASADLIAPAPFQPRTRFDEERLAELARAVKSQGIIEPLIVRAIPGPAGASYQLIAGERRLRAARAAGLDAVPVVVRDVSDREALEMSLVENLAREELTPIDEARAFERLSSEFGLTHEELALRIGKSRPYVTNLLRLLALPGEIIEMLENRRLTPGQARPLLALESDVAQVAAAHQIIARGMTARGAEQLAEIDRRDRAGSPSRMRRDSATDDPNVLAIADRLQRLLKRKVRIVRYRGKRPGRIELEYYDDNDMTALAYTIFKAAQAASAEETTEGSA